MRTGIIQNTTCPWQMHTRWMIYP